MDSLLATYASSDEEDQPPPPQPSSKPSISLFSSLPKPQSSSLFSSLPKPQSSSSSSSQIPKQENPSSSSLFSSLPPPKSETTLDLPFPPPKSKRVVQFRPPVPQPSSHFDDDDDDDDEDEEKKQRKKKTQLVHDTSVKSFLSSMPTPKSSGHSSLGALPSSLGSGRRSIIETESAPLSSDANGVSNEVGVGSNVENNRENLVDGSNYNSYDEVGVAGGQGYANDGGYDAYPTSSDYGGYGQYDSSTWSAGESAATTSLGGAESFARLGGKRRKDQAPTDFVEVKQDELMKNRPTQDKSKLTGIAFGPAYQPASTKGKPSKLHKRKHQIGSLYFDMKQKEMELSERRAKGFLTKAETQAKYGW